MNWKIKASLQKILSFSKLGDQLNHIPVLFQKKYHKNVFLYQSHECIRKFSCASLQLKGNEIALEIGTGYSLISAAILSLLGFEKIITVDITKDIRFSTFKKQISYINSNDFLHTLADKSIYSKDEILRKITLIQQQKSLQDLCNMLNITYIAPYTFDEIEKYSKSFDYICSQVVLEHVLPEMLDELFKRTKHWLTPNGYGVHTINFIDHFANQGFFQDTCISEFNFLQYSNQYWDFWAGNSIAYTNRLSYLYYIELCAKYNLMVIDFQGENYRKRVRFDENLIHSDVLKKYSTLTDKSVLTKYQRGTLILKG